MYLRLFIFILSVIAFNCRPAYRKLSSLKSDLPDVPLLALTATAAPKYMDICFSLFL